MLWLGAGSWLQLPAEVTMRRWLQHQEVIGARLADGKHKGLGFRGSVLFPAGKEYYGENETGKETLPESTLPWDIYGPPVRKGEEGEARYTQPQFIMSGAFIGEARDVKSFLKAAVGVSKADSRGFDEAAVWSRLFLRQELARREYPRPNEAALNRIRNMLLSTPTPTPKQRPPPPTPTSKTQPSPPEPTPKQKPPPPPPLGHKDELGLHLDYESRIFQPLDLTSNTTADVHHLTFNRPILARSRSRSAAHLYNRPLRLPPELPPDTSPLAHINLSTSDTPYRLPLDQDISPGTEPPPMHSYPTASLLQQLGELNKNKNVTWSSMPFLTNVVAPRGSIPSVLIPSSSDPAGLEFGDDYWREMWFVPYARILLHGYLYPDRAALARDVTSGGGGERIMWWNDRGGRGGIWTDLGGSLFLLPFFT